MADEDDIKELIGRMVAAHRQGFHVTPAHIRIILAGLRFLLATKTWLARPITDPHDEAPLRKPEKYTGPPATIGDLRRSGLVAVSVTCDGPNCWNTKRVTFDALALDNATQVPEIAGRRRFRCRKCGCRPVRVSADWTDQAAQGNGRPAVH